jgi:hypothetical protein
VEQFQDKKWMFLLNSSSLREYRKSLRESQFCFWSRFGVTQSRGSRFETGAEIPSPVAILLKLYIDGTITDGDLCKAPVRKGKLDEDCLNS